MWRLGLAAPAVASSLALGSCHQQPSAQTPLIIETQWTRNAAERTERLLEAAPKRDPRHGAIKYSLPQLRVYGADGELVYLLDPSRGWNPESVGHTINAAIDGRHPIPGPSLRETLADLQTADGRSARMGVARGAPLVFDYWASWCVPCKVLEAALVKWAANKPPGSVQIVKAETDIMKAGRSAGEKTYIIKRTSDGKARQVEMT